MKKLKQLLLWTMLLCCLFSFTAFAYPAALPLPALSGKQSEDVARIAESQVYYEEDASGATVYGSWWGLPTGDWCAMFACWCANQAGAGKNISYNSSSAVVGNMYNFLANYGTVNSTFSTSPQRGDFLFASNERGLAHVMVVTGYDPSTSTISYVGGNQYRKNYRSSVTSGTCGWYSGATVEGLAVYGFGRPNYPQNDYPTVPTFTNADLPKMIEHGGYIPMSGTISSRSAIGNVTFSLYDSKGAIAWSKTVHPNSGTYTLSNDSASEFQQADVDPGVYTFTCTATNRYGTHTIFNYTIFVSADSQNVENGVYNICLSSNPNMNLTVQDNSNANGANVLLWNTSTAHQYDDWKIEHFYSGYYKIINVGSGKALDVTGRSSANCTNIQQYEFQNYYDEYSRLWKLVPDGNGCYYFIPGFVAGSCMDAANGSNAPGTNVWLYEFNYSHAQRWKLVGGCTHSSLSKVSAKAATCTAAGNSLYYKCTKCNKLFTSTSASKEIKLADTVIAAKGHKWNSSYTVDKKATCDTNGSKSIHCSVCNGIKANSSKAIEKTGHKYGSATIVKATFTKNGSSTRKCSSCGSKKVTTILKIETPKLATTKYTYNGLSKKPTVTVTNTNGKVLKAGTDYTLSYASGRKSVGRYGVTVKLAGNYSGSKTVYFTIAPKAPSSAKAVLNENYDQVKLTWSKSTGASGYSVYYRNASVSNSKFVLTGRTPKTQYTMFDLDSGSKYEFKIVPYYKTIVSSKTTYYESAKSIQKSVYTLKKLNTPTLSKSGTKVKVKWNNISGETGYQISRSTTKTGTNIVSTYATTGGTYKTVTATKGKAYYYKVRAYKTVDGKKVCGPWSTAVKYVR